MWGRLAIGAGLATRRSQPAPPVVLHREQAMEEGPVSSQRHPQIFRRDISRPVPLRLQTGPLPGKRLSNLLDRKRYEFISPLNSLSRLIHKGGLNIGPF